MEGFKGVVYITTNLINGKKYIGKDEKNNPWYKGSGKLISRAIDKYGRENFEKEILAVGKNREDLCDLEKYYIDYYTADKSDVFYNIAKGGDGGVTSGYSRFKKPVYQYSSGGVFIKKWDSAPDAAKGMGVSRLSIVKSCNYGHRSGNFLYRYQMEDSVAVKPKTYNRRRVTVYDIYGAEIGVYNSVKDTEVALSISKQSIYKSVKYSKPYKGYLFEISGTKCEKEDVIIDKSNYKKVYQYNLNGDLVKVYEDILFTPIEYNRSNIMGCLKNRRKSCSNFMWSYESSVRGYSRSTYKKGRDTTNKSKPVVAIKCGRVVNEFSSLTEASIELNIDISNISAVCRGTRSSAKGYIFKFKKELKQL